MNSLSFRDGTKSDLSQLKELGFISYGQYSTVLEPEHFNTLKTNLSKDEFWNNLTDISHIFVCEENNVIVGMAFLIPHGHPNHIYETEWSQIRMVGVHPDYSGKGIAKQLTQMCIQKAKQINEKILMLHTSEFMNAARHIYEQQGFKVYKEISPIFGKRYWLFKLDL